MISFGSKITITGIEILMPITVVLQPKIMTTHHLFCFYKDLY